MRSRLGGYDGRTTGLGTSRDRSIWRSRLPCSGRITRKNRKEGEVGRKRPRPRRPEAVVTPRVSVRCSGRSASASTRARGLEEGMPVRRRFAWRPRVPGSVRGRRSRSISRPRSFSSQVTTRTMLPRCSLRSRHGSFNTPGPRDMMCWYQTSNRRMRSRASSERSIVFTRLQGSPGMSLWDAGRRESSPGPR